jgi:hypothetical protein
MLIALGAAGVMGLVLGLRYRVPALLVASVVTATVCLAVAPFSDLNPMVAIGATFVLLGVLQVGYLTGLLVSCAWSRANLWLAGRARVVNGQQPSHGKVRTR